MAALLALHLTSHPQQLYSFFDEFREARPAPAYSNFLKGAKWSPDGICLLTAADDNWLRVYDLPRDAFDSADAPPSEPPAAAPELPAPAQQVGEERDPFWPAVRVHAGEALYDYCWYSMASSSEPASCCFATAARSHPVHLWDAGGAGLRCSYRPYNALDELAPTFSVAFDPAGAKLYAGGRGAIHIFQVERPGRDHATITTHRRGEDGQPGIISCLAFSPDGTGVMAAGAYSGVAALYDARTEEALCVLEGHAGGVTHVRFSVDGTYLYSGARRDGAVYCWDARNASGALYTIRRDTAETNQRVAFDIEPCGRHLATGGADGCVRVFDLRDGAEVARHSVAADTVTGCEFHPYLPLLATASGHRRFYKSPSSDSDSESGAESEGEGNGGGGAAAPSRDENVLRIWRFGASPAELEYAAADGEVQQRRPFMLVDKEM